MMRNLSGSIAEVCDLRTGYVGFLRLTNGGALTAFPAEPSGEYYKTTVTFSAAYQVPTGNKFAPRAWGALACVYLGLPAS